MEISITDAENIPPGCLLSLAPAGLSKRQGPLRPNQRFSWRTPGKDCMVKLDVISVLGSIEVPAEDICPRGAKGSRTCDVLIPMATHGADAFKRSRNTSPLRLSLVVRNESRKNASPVASSLQSHSPRASQVASSLRSHSARGEDELIKSWTNSARSDTAEKGNHHCQMGAPLARDDQRGQKGAPPARDDQRGQMELFENVVHEMMSPSAPRSRDDQRGLMDLFENAIHEILQPDDASDYGASRVLSRASTGDLHSDQADQQTSDLRCDKSFGRAFVEQEARVEMQDSASARLSAVLSDPKQIPLEEPRAQVDQAIQVPDCCVEQSRAASRLKRASYVDQAVQVEAHLSSSFSRLSSSSSDPQLDRRKGRPSSAKQRHQAFSPKAEDSILWSTSRIEPEDEPSRPSTVDLWRADSYWQSPMLEPEGETSQVLGRPSSAASWGSQSTMLNPYGTRYKQSASRLSSASTRFGSDIEGGAFQQATLRSTSACSSQAHQRPTSACSTLFGSDIEQEAMFGSGEQTFNNSSFVKSDSLTADLLVESQLTFGEGDEAGELAGPPGRALRKSKLSTGKQTRRDADADNDQVEKQSHVDSDEFKDAPAKSTEEFDRQMSGQEQVDKDREQSKDALARSPEEEFERQTLREDQVEKQRIVDSEQSRDAPAKSPEEFDGQMLRQNHVEKHRNINVDSEQCKDAPAESPEEFDRQMSRQDQVEKQSNAAIEESIDAPAKSLEEFERQTLRQDRLEKQSNADTEKSKDVPAKSPEDTFSIAFATAFDRQMPSVQPSQEQDQSRKPSKAETVESDDSFTAAKTSQLRACVGLDDDKRTEHLVKSIEKAIKHIKQPGPELQTLGPELRTLVQQASSRPSSPEASSSKRGIALPLQTTQAESNADSPLVSNRSATSRLCRLAMERLRRNLLEGEGSAETSQILSARSDGSLLGELNSKGDLENAVMELTELQATLEERLAELKPNQSSGHAALGEMDPSGIMGSAALVTDIPVLSQLELAELEARLKARLGELNPNETSDYAALGELDPNEILDYVANVADIPVLSQSALAELQETLEDSRQDQVEKQSNVDSGESKDALAKEKQSNVDSEDSKDALAKEKQSNVDSEDSKDAPPKSLEEFESQISRQDLAGKQGNANIEESKDALAKSPEERVERQTLREDQVEKQSNADSEDSSDTVPLHPKCFLEPYDAEFYSEPRNTEILAEQGLEIVQTNIEEVREINRTCEIENTSLRCKLDALESSSTHESHLSLELSAGNRDSNKAFSPDLSHLLEELSETRQELQESLMKSQGELQELQSKADSGGSDCQHNS